MAYESRAALNDIRLQGRQPARPQFPQAQPQAAFTPQGGQGGGYPRQPPDSLTGSPAGFTWNTSRCAESPLSATSKKESLDLADVVKGMQQAMKEMRMLKTEMKKTEMKKEQNCGCLRSLCTAVGNCCCVTTTLVIVVVVIIAIGCACVFVQLEGEKDIHKFLFSTIAYNHSIERRELSEAEKNYTEAHKFTCFEIFTVSELKDTAEAFRSTCPGLPREVKDIVAEKFRDVSKTRATVSDQDVKYEPLPDKSGQGIGYQLRFSREPYGDEYRVILFVAGIRFVAAPKDEFEEYVVKGVCKEEVLETPGVLYGTWPTKTKTCEDKVLRKRVPVPKDISKPDFNMLVQQVTKTAIEQSVIPGLYGQLSTAIGM